MKSRWAREWREALLLPGESDLVESSLRELSEYFGISREEALGRCRGALADSRGEWLSAPRTTRDEIVDFYRRTRSYIFEHMWWHAQDIETCAINAGIVELAEAAGARDCLDFGAGVGSAAILFARRGLNLTLADVSETMLEFARWRFGIRGLDAVFLNLNEEELPRDSYDLIMACDVFEHLAEPAAEIDILGRALRSGGRLVFNCRAGADPDRPMHILPDDGEIWRGLGRSGLRPAADGGADGMERYGFVIASKGAERAFARPSGALARPASRRPDQPRHPQGVYLDRLRELLRPGGVRWLELGCGRDAVPWWMRGRIGIEQELKSLAGEIIGIDADCGALRENDFCRTRIAADAMALPFADGSFDLVTANMVFEHLRRPETVLAGIHRVLRPGGRMLAITPNRLDIVSLAARAIPNRLHPAIVSMAESRSGDEAYPTYYRFNSPGRIGRLLGAAGFWRIDARLLEHPDVYSHLPVISSVERIWHGAARKLPAIRGVILVEAEKR